jgi:hypothetical protein
MVQASAFSESLLKMVAACDRSKTVNCSMFWSSVDTKKLTTSFTYSYKDKINIIRFSDDREQGAYRQL